MNEKMFSDYDALADYMFECAYDGQYVVATLFYSDAKELLHELMLNPDIEVMDVVLEHPSSNGYDKEYYLELNRDLRLTVEPAFVDGRYLDTECDFMLIDGDASSVILRGVPYGAWYEIMFGIDCPEAPEDDPCADCDLVNVGFCINEDIYVEMLSEGTFTGFMRTLVEKALSRKM